MANDPGMAHPRGCHRLFPFILLAVCAAPPATSHALDVYRIGGADLPPPGGPGIVFHQLDWGSLTAGIGLEDSAMESGRLQPFFLDPDENVALSSIARGGGPNVAGNAYNYYVTVGAVSMVDEDPVTFYEWIEARLDTWRGQQAHRITMDLGAIFTVNRVRILAADSAHRPDRLDIASETEFTPSNSVALTGDPVTRILENVADTIDVRFPPVAGRSIGMLVWRLTPKAIKISEIEVYGEGYVRDASYVGSFVDAGEPAIWGDLRWRGRQDPHAEVRVSTRSGNDLDPNKYWRFTGRGSEISPMDADGRLLTAASYAVLKPGEEAEITYDVDNWSFWTAPYSFADSSGTPILSPSPHSVLQLRVDFLSQGGNGGELQFVEFTATRPPLAEVVSGEIYPPEVELGSTTQFTYSISPTIRGNHSGFDRVEVSTPFGFAGVDSVRIDGLPVDGYQVIVEAPDSTLFAVQLPRRLGAGDSGQLVEVVFRASVLRYATQFQGWVRDSERPGELPQRVAAGEASTSLVSETLSVRTSLSNRLLADLQVSGRVLTPNGDGVNDGVGFSFDLLQLTARATVTVEIFDLAGRRVARIDDSVPGSGHLRLF